MMVAAAVLMIGALIFTLGVRGKDLPEPEPVPAGRHLEQRKAVIYENLRDLQFEYRLGKLSDQDYQATKQDLQKELAVVMAELDALAAGIPMKPAPAPEPAAKPKPVTGTLCPHCGAKFATALKFCGECGKPISAEASK